MSKRNYEIVHQGSRAVIVTGFACLMLVLLLSGNILLYIAPHLILYAWLAVIFLVAAAGFQSYLFIAAVKGSAVDCACDGDHGHDRAPQLYSVRRSVFVFVLFAIPLLLGTLLPNSALAGSLAQNKGMNLGALPTGRGAAGADLVEVDGNQDPALKQLFKTDVYNRDYAKLGMLLYGQDVIEMKDEWFIEKQQALNLFADSFKGKTIRITGFVYREEGLSDSQFIVGRMAMTHCIADISPYGFIVDSPDAAQYADDTWITVTGTIDQTDYHGQKVVKIVIGSAEPASPAKIPYVYPDWNFASKL
ncbi:TIGR03943 family putative permease subunit [Cohnella terricola]|uniref:TIGR03943 family protein n=1 Tax=Cohnella terricola TaxID=1289167 RepID=A0A559J9D7_9BACL|nr:TIGR03943 family protein [Cohnella terricola]TVX96509.1 TIGR03943 family protein [Cohnella terricola]